jgi:hypothetical protein
VARAVEVATRTAAVDTGGIEVLGSGDPPERFDVQLRGLDPRVNESLRLRAWVEAELAAHLTALERRLDGGA